MGQIDVLDGLKARLTRRPLRDQIAAGLAALIEAGLLAPGDELPAERDLAALLEVGRESVRSALQTLAAHGMVEISHGARCRVAGPAGGALAGGEPPLEIRFAALPPSAVTDARLALEPLLTGRAAARLDGAALDRLRRLVRAQGTMLSDPVRFQISDREFHLLLHRGAGSPILAAFAEEVYAHAYPLRREAMRSAGGTEQALADHVAILAAVERRDGAAAGAAMAAHIRNIGALVEACRERRAGEG